MRCRPAGAMYKPTIWPSRAVLGGGTAVFVIGVQSPSSAIGDVPGSGCPYVPILSSDKGVLQVRTTERDHLAFDAVFRALDGDLLVDEFASVLVLSPSRSMELRDDNQPPRATRPVAFLVVAAGYAALCRSTRIVPSTHTYCGTRHKAIVRETLYRGAT